MTSWQQDLCFEFLAKFPLSYRALMRLADCTHDRPHVSTNAYARALSLNPALHDYIVKRLRKLAPFAGCGPFQVEGQERLPDSLLFPVSKPQHHECYLVENIYQKCYAVATRSKNCCQRSNIPVPGRNKNTHLVSHRGKQTCPILQYALTV